MNTAVEWPPLFHLFDRLEALELEEPELVALLALAERNQPVVGQMIGVIAIGGSPQLLHGLWNQPGRAQSARCRQ